MAERIRLSIARGKKAHIIVVAEGEDAGGAFVMGQRIGAMLEHDYRVVVLGHIQRGGAPTVRDRIIAAQTGARAVDALAQGRSGMMIGMQRGDVVEIPLSVVVEHGHAAPDLEALYLAERLSG
jgi:6-phosphofructokinase 1